MSRIRNPRTVVVALAASAVAGVSLLMWPGSAGHAATVGGGTHSLPHFSISRGQDVVLHAVNNGGLGTLGAGGTAQVQVYLFNADGTPMKGSSGTDVCSAATECEVSLPAGVKHSFSFGTALADSGGTASGTAVGFAIVMVTGAGANEVALAAQHLDGANRQQTAQSLDLVRIPDA